MLELLLDRSGLVMNTEAGPPDEPPGQNLQD
jgi:hypothetical protein